FSQRSLSLGIQCVDVRGAMTGRERTSLKKALEALERELSARGTERISPNRTSEEEIGGDEDEQPLNEMLQTIASSRNKNLGGTLGLVRAALQKLKDSPDDFGVCEECGEEIAMGRLKAMPYAPLCVTCQGKRDGPKVAPTRRKLTDYV